jgi:hypothetical protein
MPIYRKPLSALVSDGYPAGESALEVQLAEHGFPLDDTSTQFVQNEKTRISNELTRIGHEENRVDAELLRPAYHTVTWAAYLALVEADTLIDNDWYEVTDAPADLVEAFPDYATKLIMKGRAPVTSEAFNAAMKADEEARVAAEAARALAEGARDTAEDLRLSAETARNQAEGLRDSAEDIRIQAETDRGLAYLAAESDRDDAYDAAELVRNSNYGQEALGRAGEYATAEDARDTAYGQAEIARGGLYAGEEGDRGEAYAAQELVRDGQYANAESARDDLYDAAELDRDGTFSLAEGGRALAEGSRVIAEEARVDAEALRPQYHYLTWAQYQALITAHTLVETDFYEIADAPAATTQALQDLIDATVIARDNAITATGLANTATSNANAATSAASSFVASHGNLEDYTGQAAVVGNRRVYLGSLYECILNASAGTLPTNATYYKCVASKGTDGPSTAAGISIADAGNYFAGAQVEAITQELGLTTAGHTTQLAQIALQRVSSAKLVKLPADFVPTLPCNFYRYNSGYTMHDMSFDQYKTGTKIYVTSTGSDTTGTGAIDAPFKTMKKALETARDGADAAYQIITDTAIFGRYQLNFNSTFVNKTIAIVSTNPLGTIFCANDTYVWTLDGAGTYKCTRSGVTGVLDNSYRDVYGVPVPLIKKTDLATCQATAGTWYTDSTYLWVHRSDGVTPTYDSTIVNIGADDFDPTLNNSKLYCENIIFAGFSSTGALRVRTTAYAGTEACFRDCKFVSGMQVSGSGNCLALNDVYRTYMFNCVAGYGQLDGFNYHFLNVAAGNRRSCLVLEYNCVAYHHGIEFEGTGSNNASTCHDGVSVVRFGTIGFHTTTPVIVDISGCYSILYDCESENPISGGVEATGECYRFSQDSGANRAKAILINCTAKRCTSAIYGDSGTDLVLSRFTYDGTINSNGTLKYQ